MRLYKTIRELCNGYKAVIDYCEEELRRLESSPHRKYLQQEQDRVEGALAQYRRELEYWSKQDLEAPSWYGIPSIRMSFADEIMRRAGYEV